MEELFDARRKRRGWTKAASGAWRDGVGRVEGREGAFGGARSARGRGQGSLDERNATHRRSSAKGWRRRKARHVHRGHADLSVHQCLRVVDKNDRRVSRYSDLSRVIHADNRTSSQRPRIRSPHKSTSGKPSSHLKDPNRRKFDVTIIKGLGGLTASACRSSTPYKRSRSRSGEGKV